MLECICLWSVDVYWWSTKSDNTQWQSESLHRDTTVLAPCTVSSILPWSDFSHFHTFFQSSSPFYHLSSQKLHNIGSKAAHKTRQMSNMLSLLFVGLSVTFTVTMYLPSGVLWTFCFCLWVWHTGIEISRCTLSINMVDKYRGSP